MKKKRFVALNNFTEFKDKVNLLFVYSTFLSNGSVGAPVNLVPKCRVKRR